MSTEGSRISLTETRFHDAMIHLAATLKPPAPNQIRSLLDKAGPLLGLVSELDLKGLIDQLKDVDIAGIVSKVLQLLTDGNLKNIDRLLTNGASLLTPDFVKQIKGLIGDVSPLLDELTPLLKKLTGLVEIQLAAHGPTVITGGS